MINFGMSNELVWVQNKQKGKCLRQHSWPALMILNYAYPKLAAC